MGEFGPETEEESRSQEEKLEPGSPEDVQQLIKMSNNLEGRLSDPNLTAEEKAKITEQVRANRARIYELRQQGK